MHVTALLVGALLPLGVGVFATISGLDRDRAFYPTLMIVIAALYSLFAAIGESTHALVLDALIGLVFIAAATVGFRSSLWLVAAALAAHGALDSVHGAVVSNPGVPPWWPAFCGTYDVVAAGYLAWLLTSGRIRAIR
jgi:uncharacterized membrane protein HdeD (DUF308 family)